MVAYNLECPCVPCLGISGINEYIWPKTGKLLTTISYVLLLLIQVKNYPFDTFSHKIPCRMLSFKLIHCYRFRLGTSKFSLAGFKVMSLKLPKNAFEVEIVGGKSMITKGQICAKSVKTTIIYQYICICWSTHRLPLVTVSS